MKKTICSLPVFVALFFSPVAPVHGETLMEAVGEVLSSNPDFTSLEFNRLAREKEVTQAKAGYLPTLGFVAGAGVEKYQEPQSEDFTPKELQLSLRQNIFAGFSTMHEVKRQKLRVESMSFTQKATAENLALKTSKVYLDVLRNQDLKKLAEENLTIHQRIADQIKLRSTSGVGSLVDIDQAQGRVSLAQSNLVVAQTNLTDALTSYYAVVGQQPSNLVRPAEQGKKLPANLEEAEKLALENHPTLKSAGSDLFAREEQQKVAKSPFMPSLDAEVDQNWNDEVDGIDGKQQNTIAMLKLRFNFFNGLKDYGRHAETQHLVSEAREIRNSTIRQVKESIRLSWMAYQSTLDRNNFVTQRVKSAQAAANSFTKQFELGKRTLLDVLDTEAEAITAKRDLINLEYDSLYAQYRILNGTGGLVSSLGLDISKQTTPQ